MEVISVPGKIFLLGEYLALSGGPALVAAVKPRFSLSVEGSETFPLNNDCLLSRASECFHPQSPAGLNAAEILNKLKIKNNFLTNESANDLNKNDPLRLNWVDPYSGCGGFGGSTAEFIVIDVLGDGDQEISARADRLNQAVASRERYLKFFEKQELPPSGYDVLAQWMGGVNLIQQSSVEAITSAALPLHSILVFQSTEIAGRKAVTHSHLRDLKNFDAIKIDNRPLKDILFEIMKAAISELNSRQFHCWGNFFNRYAEVLSQGGLESEAAKSDRLLISKMPGVYGVKGSGALLTDGVLVVMDNHPQSRAEVISVLQNRGHRYLGTLQELTDWNGVTKTHTLKNAVVGDGVSNQKESWIRVRAPSNIALVKYMGKKEGVEKNLPENSSLSMTLSALCTEVELKRKNFNPAAIRINDRLESGSRKFTGQCDWTKSLEVGALSRKEIERMERHFDRIDQQWESLVKRFSACEKELLCAKPKSKDAKEVLPLFEGSTRNTFPSASGIASSASAFAAWTLAWVGAHWPSAEEFHSLWKGNPDFRQTLAQLSREGSGSSCRSFFGPFVQWNADGDNSIATEVHPVKVHPIFKTIVHYVLVVSALQKKVGSSEAHHRVKTSPLWGDSRCGLASHFRPARAEDRLTKMRAGLEAGDFKGVAQLAWSECFEMHSLFHTANPSFTYWSGATINSLAFLEENFVSKGLPVIVTMDAGPNVHVLVAADFAETFEKTLNQDLLAPALNSGSPISLLKDQPGGGPEFFFGEVRLEKSDSAHLDGGKI